jgi:hypothetical protein
MKHTLLAFDTDTAQGKVRHTLMGPEYGYIHVLNTTEKDFDLSLPVNALTHSGKSPEQAVTDTKAVCQALGVSLRKCLVFEVTEASGL